MAPKDDQLSLVFNLERHSSFFFKCQRCSVCCLNKSIEVTPYEILRISRNLGITTNGFLKTYVEDESTILCNKPNGECIFLASHGCQIHPDRPLVCRLYPLGLIWDANGKERFGIMPLHPDCLGLLSDEETVESYLESQSVEPYFLFDKKYSRLFRRG
jgi:Fe-S-cluster containining protein